MKKLFILLFPALCFAEDTNVFPIGHNLDFSSETSKAGHCTVGFQFAGCGVSNQFTLGFSPWMLTDYNSYNLFARYSFDKTEDHQRGFQFAYLKSYAVSPSRYQMELVWLSYIHTVYFHSEIKSHFNVSGMYFFDDTNPFSMRRPQFYYDPFQLNFGVLNEFHLYGPWYVNVEFAIVDAIKKYFHLHMGASLEFRGSFWLAHIGLSHTTTMDALVNVLDRYDYGLTYFPTNRIPEGAVRYDYSIHPEISFQIYF